MIKKAAKVREKIDANVLHRAVDDALKRFGLHSAMVIAVGEIDGLGPRFGHQTMVTGCEDCAAAALAHALRQMPESMREPFLRAWASESESDAASKTVN